MRRLKRAVQLQALFFPLALFACGELGFHELRALQDTRPTPGSTDSPRIAGRVEKVAELGLTLTFPAELSQVEPMAAAGPESQQKAVWSARLGTAKIWIYVYGMPR